MSKYVDDILARQQQISESLPQRDPFDEGIQRAIRSSKESVSMDDEQTNQALRNSILTFADNLGQMPKTRGFFSNFNQVGKALSPAIRAYDSQEQDAINANTQQLEKAFRDREALDAKAAQLEQMAYDRQMKEAQMQAQREYQTAMLDNKREHQEQQRQSVLSKLAGQKPAYVTELVKSNVKGLAERNNRNIKDQALVETLNDMESAIKEAIEQGQVGSTLDAIGRRKFANYISGDNKAATLADAAKYAYFSRFKEAGGANINEKEFVETLKTIPSVEKNPEAALQQIDLDKRNALKRINDFYTTNQNLVDTQFEALPGGLNPNLSFSKPEMVNNDPIEEVDIMEEGDQYDNNFGEAMPAEVNGGDVRLMGPDGQIEILRDDESGLIQELESNGFRRQ